MTIEKPRSKPPLHRLWKRAFGDPDSFIDSFFAYGFHEDRCLCIYKQGQLAAALYWFDCSWKTKRLAYLYAIATDPDFQGQGLCRKLMDYTHKHLQALGYAGAVLVPGSKALFAMYEKFGYRCFGSIRKFRCEAAEPAVPLTAIPAEEYARLRRVFLPEGGVVQEGAVLAFLDSQMDFYTGEGCLLCAAREGNTLIAAELLGNAELAPGIVKTLGCSKGHFRTAQQGTPFAMYLPFGDHSSPSYFGIALD